MLCVRGKNRTQPSREGFFSALLPTSGSHTGLPQPCTPSCGFLSGFLKQSSDRGKHPPYPLILEKLFFFIIIEPIKTCDLYGQKLNRQMSDSQINMDTLSQGWCK